MLKKILYSLIIVILIGISIVNSKAESNDETCTYIKSEAMFICGNQEKTTAVYCNYKDSESKIEDCEERISENNKYKKYYRAKWKRHCENSAMKQRGEYCQYLNENFLFYRDEFFNLFLEDLNLN